MESTAIAQLPRNRSVETIHATMEGERQFLNYMLRIACDYLDVDIRPIIFDGHMSQRGGPSPVPDELSEEIASQKAKIAVLECELHDAYQRERHYR